MAKWRKLHINGEIWDWMRSKTSNSIVIREPDRGKYHTIPFDSFDVQPDPITFGYRIVPSIVKSYIERNIIGN